MMRRKTWRLVLAGLVAAAVLAGAREGAAGEPAQADTALYYNPFEVIITAPRLNIPLKQNPAATSIVSPGELRTMPRGVGAEEALRTVPGVRVDNQADGERVHLSIRGQGILSERGIRGIKVLLDGLPLNDPTGVAPDLYDVDWATVERIEVLRGPSAALYGGGGSGGVVNITTGGGAGRPRPGRLATTFGSHGFMKALGEAGGVRGDVDCRVSFSRALGDGYRTHTAFSARNAYQKLQWTPSSRVRLTQILGWTDFFDENAEGLNIDQVRENPRQPNPDAETFNEYYHTKRFLGGVTGEVGMTDRQELLFSGYFRDTRFGESVPSSVRHRSMLSPGMSVQYNVHGGGGSVKNHLSLGSDIQWQGIDEYRLKNLGGAREDTLLSNQHIAQRGTGLFVLDRIELGAQWGVMLGARYDDMRNRLADLMAGDTLDLSGEANFHRGTTRVGVSYTPRPRLSLYANWGQGFLPPATEELANNPEHPGGFNRGLEPATSHGEEVGARGAVGGAVSYDLALFRLVTDRDFDRYRILPERPLETFYRNVGSSRRYGLETALRYRPAGPVSAGMAYTYSHLRYSSPDSLEDNRLPNSPDHQLTALVDYEPWDGFVLGVSCEVQSRWYVDKENSASVGGFTLWGARADCAWHAGGLAGEVTLAGRNLFAREYMAFTEPDPDGNSYQPGPKREVFLGVTVRGLGAPR